MTVAFSPLFVTQRPVQPVVGESSDCSEAGKTQKYNVGKSFIYGEFIFIYMKLIVKIIL